MNLVVAMLVLDSPVLPTQGDVSHQFARACGADAGRVALEHGMLSLELGEVQISGTVMEAPIPWSDLEGPVQTSLLWRGDPEAIRRHPAHFVAAASGDKEPKELSLTLTKAIVALLRCMEAPAVYWGEARHLIARDIFCDFGEEGTLEFLPLYLWVDFRCYRESDGTHSLFTTGLETLGLMEVEVQRSTADRETIIDRAFNLAHYLLDNGPVIADGQTFGLSAEERLKVRHTRSFVTRDRKVYRLQIP